MVTGWISALVRVSHHRPSRRASRRLATSTSARYATVAGVRNAKYDAWQPGETQDKWAHLTIDHGVPLKMGLKAVAETYRSGGNGRRRADLRRCDGLK